MTSCLLILFFMFRAWLIWMSRPSDELRAMRNIIKKINLYHINVDGIYPETLINILNFNDKKGTKFYYVSGLTTNDPPRTPIIIKRNDYFPSRGWILTKEIKDCRLTQIQQKYEQHDFNSEKRIEIINEPWKLVENDFETIEEYMMFTNRLRLIETYIIFNFRE